MAHKRFLIADDDKRIRDAVRALFEAHGTGEVCGEAVDGLEAVELAPALQPDMVILDWQMPKLNGVEAAEIISKDLPGVPIVLFTMHATAGVRLDLRRAGICAVLDKGDPEKLLYTAQTLTETKARSEK
jgi:two-component system, NarL family, response regulator DesR